MQLWPVWFSVYCKAYVTDDMTQAVLNACGVFFVLFFFGGGGGGWQGFFFGCLRGRNKAPFPMRFRRIFSQFVEKNSQSQLKTIFNSSIPCEI